MEPSAGVTKTFIEAYAKSNEAQGEDSVHFDSHFLLY